MGIGQEYGAIVGVHRDLGAASASRCALHLPTDASSDSARRALGEAALIGQSCHNLTEIERATRVDYVTVSPVFGSFSKPSYGPLLGAAGLRALVAAARVPVIALGGIGIATVPGLADIGVGGIAIMGEAMSAPNPDSWFANLLQVWESHCASV